MQDDNRDYAARVAVLPPSKRALLAAWLARVDEYTQHESAADIHGTHLLACVVGPKDRSVGSTELREHVSLQLPDHMVPQRIVFVDEIPRGAGGKIDRRALHQLARTKSEDVPRGITEPRSEPERLLADIWAEVLELEMVGVDDDFFEVGGDSLLSIRILARARREGITISAEDFFSNLTVARQAAVAETGALATSDAGPVTGGVPLTPIQHWFFEHTLIEPHHWNQCALFSLADTITPSLLERALEVMLLHHDQLRARFVYTDARWQQSIGDLSGKLPLDAIDLDGVDGEAFESAIIDIARSANESFELAHGPLIRMTYVATGKGECNRLLITVHHLAIDGVSWRILLEDLETLCGQLTRGESTNLPAKTTSFKTWATRLTELAPSESIRAELPYWSELGGAEDASLPTDQVDVVIDSRVADIDTVRVVLDPKTTRALLEDVPQRFNSRINESLLTALAVAVTKWKKCSAILIDVEGHGREDLFGKIDVSRTIGWFTTVFPVLLEFEGSALDALPVIKERLRGVPRRGIGHGILRHLCDDEAIAGAVKAASRAELCFNYAGQFDELSANMQHVKFERDLNEATRSEASTRAYVLEVNAWVHGGYTQIEWQYSTRSHRRETIESLAADFRRALEDLIVGSADSGVTAYTPSDFPLADLDHDELEHLADMIDEADDSAEVPE